MIITKANAKENLGGFIGLSITKEKAKTNLQIFICNCFRADGRMCTQTESKSLDVQKNDQLCGPPQPGECFTISASPEELL